MICLASCVADALHFIPFAYFCKGLFCKQLSTIEFDWLHKNFRQFWHWYRSMKDTFNFVPDYKNFLDLQVTVH